MNYLSLFIAGALLFVYNSILFMSCKSISLLLLLLKIYITLKQCLIDILGMLIFFFIKRDCVSLFAILSFMHFTFFKSLINHYLGQFFINFINGWNIISLVFKPFYYFPTRSKIIFRMTLNTYSEFDKVLENYVYFLKIKGSITCVHILDFIKHLAVLYFIMHFYLFLLLFLLSSLISYENILALLLSLRLKFRKTLILSLFRLSRHLF